MISLTESQFLNVFPDREDLYELLNTKPASHEELIQYYLPSKLWRLNNLYTVIDKDGNPVPFRMNMAQMRVYANLLIHWRLIILKSRQQGISTFFLISYFDDAIFRSHLKVGLMAQGREEASTLLERVKFSWDMLDNDIKNFLQIKKTYDNSSEFSFSNHSSIFIRTSFRSATLQRLHISEYGKIANESPKKAKETKTGTLQTLAPGNFGAIESTAEGHNDFKTMWDEAKQNEIACGGDFAAKDFKPLFLSWLDDPTCLEPKHQTDTKESIEYFDTLEKRYGLIATQEQKNFWIAQYRELGGDIYQEYPATDEEAFRASRDGTYWSKLYIREVVRRGRIRKALHDPHLPVYAVVDSGIHDYFVYTFFQVFKSNLNNQIEIRIIGEFFNTGENLHYYAKYLLKELPSNWDVEHVWLPHDFAVQDISAGQDSDDSRTREDIFKEHLTKESHKLGYEKSRIKITVLDKWGIQKGIENVKDYIPYMYIDETCEYIEKCILGYAKKWDDKTQKWDDSPAKSIVNHGADTVRYLGQVIATVFYKPRQQKVTKSQANGVAL